MRLEEGVETRVGGVEGGEDVVEVGHGKCAGDAFSVAGAWRWRWRGVVCAASLWI